MSQAEDNIIYQGQIKTLTLRLRDAEDDPWDLTGKFIRARLLVSGVPYTFDCSISGNGLIGKVTFSMTSSQTILLEEGALVMDVAVSTIAFTDAVPIDWDASDDLGIEQIWTSSGDFTVQALGNGAMPA